MNICKLMNLTDRIVLDSLKNQTMLKENSNIYAVILNYKNYHDTIECIKALLKSSYGNLRITVIDNGSGNDSLEHIIKWLMTVEMSLLYFEKVYDRWDEDNNFLESTAKINLIQAKHNNGFAAGNNIVLRRLAQIDCFVFLVNPDVVVDPDTVTKLHDFVFSKPLNVIAGCRIMNYYTKALKFYGAAKLNNLSGTVTEIKQMDTAIDFICGGAAFFRSLALKEIGLLPNDYFLYWEDAEWGYIAKQKNYALVFCIDAVVYDKGGTSIGRGYLAEYYYTRNALIFYHKMDKQVFTIILSNIFFRLPKKLILGQFKRARAVIDGTFDFILKKYINAAKKEINIG